MNIKCASWSDLKTAVSNRVLSLQYETSTALYYTYASDGLTTWTYNIKRDSGAEVTDFETNHKANANRPAVAKTDDGKPIVRSESRPIGCTTYFTSVGDDTGIGDGTELSWDFSNSTDDVPAPSGFSRKRIEFKFLDTVYLKEGTIYFHNAVKNSYIDIMVVCPNGQYYYDNDGDAKQATADTVINQYVFHHHIQGTVAMGDELNTESCSPAIPNNYKFWIEVTVPDTDTTSNGSVQLELYRTRTVVL